MQRGKNEEILGARKWVGEFQAKFVQIPREENEQADHLAKAILAEHMLIPSKVFSFV